MSNYMKESQIFPFTAIIGQEEMKKGLILNVINPKIGGILVYGEKGTAKSTAVRAIANLLPKIKVVKGCRFRCNPDDVGSMCVECREKIKKNAELETELVRMRVVDLPVSATEDRVVGCLDIEQAIKKGEKVFEPGILAQSNRGILYIDEINLLDDHIVDLLLDSAAMGVNTIEREGVSYTHPANFILVGTMNPEEGELRPQLLDRFGFSVEIKGIREPLKRVEIVKRRGEFEKNPTEFLAKYDKDEKELCQKITDAMDRFDKVEVADEVLLANASIAIRLDIDGHRGDLTLMKAAMASAAFAGREQATTEDVKEVAKMVLLHRIKSQPFEREKEFDEQEVFAWIDEVSESGGLCG